MAIYDEYVVVGAERHNDRSGAAYVFQKDAIDEDWNETAKLQSDDTSDDLHFGNRVAINQQYIIIGSRLEDVGDDINGGAVYVFQQSPTDQTWLKREKLIASDGADTDQFGVSLAIHSGNVIIGAWLDDDHGDAAGSAYIFGAMPTTNPSYDPSQSLFVGDT